MSGTSATPAHFRTLALVLALCLFGYVIWTADQISSLAPVRALASVAALAPVAALASAGGDPAGGSTVRPSEQTGDRGAAAGQPGRPLSPRLAACCEIAMGVTMGYMLIMML